MNRYSVLVIVAVAFAAHAFLGGRDEETAEYACAMDRYLGGDHPACYGVFGD